MDLLRDLRYALRTMRRSPGFTAVAALSLALGVGANTAIFSLIDTVLLKMLPVRDPERLAVISDSQFRGRGSSFSYPMYCDLRDRNDVFTGVVARFGVPIALSTGGATERVSGELVSGNYFEVLGVRAFLGRALTPQDDTIKGAHPVCVLSHGFWKRRFGADAAVVGKTIHLNGHPFTVIGVTPPGFYGMIIGQSPDIRVPMMMKPQITPVWDQLDNRRSNWLTMMARLKPGLSHQEAETRLNGLYQQIRETEAVALTRLTDYERKRFLARRIAVDPGGQGFSGLCRQFSKPLLVLMCVVGIVLLIACANLASLLLARATARRKEIAVRLALGAGRARIVRQLLTESLLLAGLGGLLGVFLAWWGSNALIAAMPLSRPNPPLHVTPDFRVLGFTFAISLLTGVLFGLAPAWQATRPQVAPTLKDEGAALAGGARPLALRQALMVSQVALSLLLLVGAGLFVRTLRNLKNVDAAMERAHVLQLSGDPSLNNYKPDRARQFFRQLVQRVEALPGVRSAAVADVAVLSGGTQSWTVAVEGYQPRQGEDMNPYMNVVSPRFFETLGIPILLGRTFTPREMDGPPRAALVNQTFARYYFGDQNPIGRRFGFDRGKFDIEIVGVVRDGKYAGLREKTPRFFYIPPGDLPAGDMTLYVRTVGDPSAVITAVRREVQALDRNLPVFNVKTLEDQADEAVAQERLVAWLSSFFGLLATLLAAVGLYGVMAYSVLRRTREIGIRMALGAEGGRILWLVLRETVLLAAIGIALGVPGALALTRLAASLLFGLAPTDIPTLLTAVALMAAVAFFSGYLPARRATRVDPMVALRYE